ncbi:NAD(P)/FAD-dependent oxidoreductase [Rhodoplanes sp. TEM]|uniref:NAD(P)/FAD-dependent oxidoreductase n=1 Tax=Rhodoplanes tepidamans TaxID=200616 RepID=A0ABT5JI05_RHOTP|nr:MULTISPECIES: NAD(P)/FAD-dependent oxidoreductase [Rhodoplanes]MDC7789339.1 NAD(P)/FAD-dependent oxidoreductase [Rhodoplanes tepidamans]MDC7986028.1 NAD(P)/FAD-dependent oxidoreductase [Rhodoplanes sp. TEM]MDQ0358982.1 flavin-dependent dehydrogenase [Rhodoplanes tepidamans]
MREVETIVVGGGPAGSTCARRLRQHGRDVLVLDKARFPRLKLCAGWITEKVLRDLEIAPGDYPHPMLPLDIRSHLRGMPGWLRWFPTPGKNFSIRRVEFDAWLLARSGAEVVQHEVRAIRRDGDRFVIDETYACRWLIGAGGTMCPARRALFPNQRPKSRQIVTLEKEFAYPSREDTCRLYFKRGLVGYAWVVPKGDGHVNIGLGAKAKYLRTSGANIHEHFRAFLDDLVAEGRLDAATADGLQETGHPYYLFTRDGAVRSGNCLLIGDSAGLATMDLGEGIGPAVESGLMAADEILGRGTWDKSKVTLFSLAGLAQRFMRAANRRHLPAA